MRILPKKRSLLFIIGGLSAIMLMAAFLFAWQIGPLLPEIDDSSFLYQLTDPNEEDGILILDSTEYVSQLEDLSVYIIPALIAIEDQRFYDHIGVDPIRIIGAALANLRNGFGVEGGSTITQQLVKITYLDQSEKTLERKMVEAVTAIRLERKYSKDQILLSYINKIYFGKSGYGLRNATLFYFDKEPGELTLAESAIITGIIQNPSLHSPFNRPESMLNRAALVISRMEEQDSITSSEAREALETLKGESLIVIRP